MLKKIIAPIIIAVLASAAMGAYFGWIACLIPYVSVKVIIIVVLAALIAAMITVTVQRIREIKKEDIDDVVSKY
jgi:hypothetical protein